MNNPDTPTIKRNITFSHTCTQCGHVDEVALGVELLTERPRTPYEEWLVSLTADVRRTVEQMDRNGLLRAYQDAATEVLTHPPRNAAKALLNYFRVATPMKITTAAQLILMQQFGRNRRIEILQHTRIAALFVDGTLAMFAPQALFDVPALQNGGASRTVAVGEMAKAADAISGWVKTKMGYVPKEASLFFAEMRRRSAGEFARAAAGGRP